MADEPVFDSVNLVVTDMDATLAFYRRLGISIPDRGPWDSHHRTAETRDGIELELDRAEFAERWDAGWRGAGGAVLGFKVATRAEVDRIHDDLTSAGYASQQAPYGPRSGAPATRWSRTPTATRSGS